MTDLAEKPVVDDRRIDLDAARAARREKQGPPPSIVAFGEEWILPRSLPADVVEIVGLVMGGDVSAVAAAIRTLLGGDTYARLGAKAAEVGDPLDLDDLSFLLEEVLAVYKVTLGESQASDAPS